MRTCFILLILFTLCSTLVGAQAKFGDNRTSIQPGSLMELESTNKGFLNIRLNTSQMNSITVTAASNGMMIYNTDSGCLCLYTGVAWKNMCNNQQVHQLKRIYTANAGDSVFLSPDIIYGENNVQVFRNGVQVNFTANLGTNTLILESSAICKQDDEIKIIQLAN